MNTYTIESFFENYKELIPSVIEKGRILRLGYNEENGFSCAHHGAFFRKGGYKAHRCA